LAIVIIVLVLLQHGKGADMGAAFGSGSSGSLFGASGSASFLSRTTGVVAALFFATSMGLTYLSVNKTEDSGVMSVMDEINESVASPAIVEKEAVQESVPVPEIPEPSSSSKAGQIPK
tara:strand:+ start:982 stop:1335 length:354 start_codon:yes stop_codon:yes gene_type:complete